MRRMIVASMGALTFALSACQSTDFAGAELVEKDRPLAGRVSVNGDPSRATPQPNEQASYTLLVGSPGVQVTWNYALVVCHLSRGDDGIATCDRSLSLIAGSSQPSSARPPDVYPSIDFTVPDASQLAPDEQELLVAGLLCPDSALDPALLDALRNGDDTALSASPNACQDKAKNGLIVASPFRIERTPDDRNHAPAIANTYWSPKISPTPVTPGSPWTSVASADLPRTGCRGAGMPEVAALPKDAKAEDVGEDKGKNAIGLQFTLESGAAETYLEQSVISGEAAASRTEVPAVEGYASAGKFIIVRDNAKSAEQTLQLEWNPPKLPIDASGVLVRFWIVAHDDRERSAQASSWIERALCVVPP
jgi:hypothetical protein